MLTKFLHPKEIALLLRIRNKYRYGRIEIFTRDGLPYRIRKAEEYDDLVELAEDDL